MNKGLAFLKKRKVRFIIYFCILALSIALSLCSNILKEKILASDKASLEEFVRQAIILKDKEAIQNALPKGIELKNYSAGTDSIGIVLESKYHIFDEWITSDATEIFTVYQKNPMANHLWFDLKQFARDGYAMVFVAVLIDSVSAYVELSDKKRIEKRILMFDDGTRYADDDSKESVYDDDDDDED